MNFAEDGSLLYSNDSVFLFALLSDGKSIESVPIENVQGLRGQISRTEINIPPKMYKKKQSCRTESIEIGV